MVRCEHREEITEMERQMTMKERECVHKISGLEAELRNAEDRYDTQVISRERECVHKISGLEAELRNAEDRYDTQVTRRERECTCSQDIGARGGATQC